MRLRTKKKTQNKTKLGKPLRRTATHRAFGVCALMVSLCSNRWPGRKREGREGRGRQCINLEIGFKIQQSRRFKNRLERNEKQQTSEDGAPCLRDARLLTTAVTFPVNAPRRFSTPRHLKQPDNKHIPSDCQLSSAGSPACRRSSVLLGFRLPHRLDYVRGHPSPPIPMTA